MECAVRWGGGVGNGFTALINTAITSAKRWSVELLDLMEERRKKKSEVAVWRAGQLPNSILSRCEIRKQR